MVVSFGCIDESRDKNLIELESLIMKTDIKPERLGSNLDNSALHAIALFEAIEDKELLSPQTYKVVGGIYFYKRKPDKALTAIEKYIHMVPNDAEALFYKGIILKEKNMEYCEYFKRAKELGFNFNTVIKFFWFLEKDPCI